MNLIDWIVLVGSLSSIALYGMWKGRGNKDMKGYLLSDNDMKWHTVAFSIMATQASAITFLSTPGQAYIDGMRFVQFYLGLPIAMVVLSVTAVPLYYKLKVYTAYEYLETHFDLKTRALAAFLFLIQRGLAAGLTIYAPSIILSVLLGWNIYWTNLFIGGIVIVYTATGGSRAVGWTQFQQMIIILLGMFAAFFMIIHLLPDHVSFFDSVKVAGKLGKLNAIDFSFSPDNKYNIWSGIIGGFFLQMSYFGTDQSQVQRYLTGESVKQSRLGLLFNGIVKVPMQFGILFIGAMLFVFYQFVAPPLFFNPVETQKVKTSVHAEQYNNLEDQFHQLFVEKKDKLNNMVQAMDSKNETEVASLQKDINSTNDKIKNLRTEAADLIAKNDPLADTNDTNYIFLSFVLKYLPAGLIGLVLAAIFAASMSSTASEINSLASTTIVDVYKRMIKKEASDRHYLIASKLATVLWGLFAIAFAAFVSQLGTLIEAVNILGSLFYGTILGIFLMAFYFKKVGATPTFLAAIIAEIVVICCFFFTGISFLWYNLIGCLLVILLAHIIDTVMRSNSPKTA